MNNQWQMLAVYPDPASAAACAGLLRSESVPVQVISDEPVPGLMQGCSLMVPAAMLARAQAILALAPISEEEWSQYVADALADDADSKGEGDQ